MGPPDPWRMYQAGRVGEPVGTAAAREAWALRGEEAWHRHCFDFRVPPPAAERFEFP